MRVDEIRLKNFRKFEDAAVSFHPEFNLLVGENGSGKTAILEALAVVLKGLHYGCVGLLTQNTVNNTQERVLDFESLTGAGTRHNNDWLVISKDGQKFIEQRFSHEVKAVIFTQYDTQPCKTHIICSQKDSQYLLIQDDVYDRKKNNSRMALQKKNGSIVFPCLVYYNISRAKKLEELPTQMRLPLCTDGYTDCWTGEFSDVLLKEWFLDREITAVQDGAIPELEAVRKAIVQAIPGCQNVQYRNSYHSFIIEMKDGKILPFHYLSDGYRNMLSVVADIAHRMARLNPHLGDDVLAETPGVVLINELDLHLHPQWQRIIAGKLREIFPKVQFIATTHSPQIINHVKPECIHILHDGENGFECVTPGESYGQTVDAILEDVMGVSPRPDEIENKLSRLFSLIERRDLDEAKQLLQEIQNAVVFDPVLIKAEHLIQWKEKAKL